MIISVALTLLLGPGVGHLYLKKFKKAALLIGATLLAAAHLAWRATSSFPNTANITPENAVQFFQDFTKNNSNLMLIYDIVFAAIWSYAVVDAFLISKKSIPRGQNGQNNGENENN